MPAYLIELVSALDQRPQVNLVIGFSLCHSPILIKRNLLICQNLGDRVCEIFS